jgi:tRNA pseudouridine55 synthase
MDGALVIDKPEGMTSHDVVARIRRVTGVRRVGHAGTLDPFATGVLVLCVGRATRLIQFLVGLEKEYLATVRLGVATDTQDLTGKQITSLSSSNRVRLEEVRSVIGKFVGEQLQTPPMFSAKKVGGERLYKAARAGREVERKPVPITIHSIELVGSSDLQLDRRPDGTYDFTVRVCCSSGAYMRTLAHDIGVRLGVGAHLAALRRLAVGRFEISQAISLEEAESRAVTGTLAQALIRPGEAIGHMPSVRLEADCLRQVARGQSVRLQESNAIGPLEEGAMTRVCDADGELVAVAEYNRMGRLLKPRVVIRAQSEA